MKKGVDEHSQDTLRQEEMLQVQKAVSKRRDYRKQERTLLQDMSQERVYAETKSRTILQQQAKKQDVYR